MIRACVFLLASLPALAQIQATFFMHPNVSIGPYVMYAVEVCNGADQSGEIAGAAVWRQAQETGVFTPQLTSVILQQKDLGTKTSAKAWTLRIAGWATTALTSLIGGKALGNVSLDTPEGKAVMAAAPIVVAVCTIGAEAVAKVPEQDVDPRVDAILPPSIKLGPHACSPQYVLWGIPLEAKP